MAWFAWLVGYIGWSVVLSAVGRFVGMVSWLVGWLDGCLLACLVGWLVGWLANCLALVLGWVGPCQETEPPPSPAKISSRCATWPVYGFDETAMKAFRVHIDNNGNQVGQKSWSEAMEPPSDMDPTAEMVAKFPDEKKAYCY